MSADAANGLSLEFADEYPEPLFRQFIYSVWS